MKRLKYANYYIGYQEVPDEIPLCINISGCPHKCEGCHSQYLWEYTGNYISDDLDGLIQRYEGMLSCVCFMGGDQNTDELSELIKKVKHEYGLKTCVYSGSNQPNVFNNIIQYLDYLKIGEYIEKVGGLNKSDTNQRFYEIKNGELDDVTYKFKRK